MIIQLKWLTLLLRQGCVFLCLLFLANVARAQITSLCEGANVCRASTAITAGVSGTVSISWRGMANLERDSTLSSDAAQLSTAQNTVLGRLQLPLRQNLQANAIGAPVRFSVNESLNVPANISLRAASLGAQQLVFTRSFTLEGQSRTASVRIDLRRASPNSGLSLSEATKPGVTALGINRMDLHFSSGRKVEVVESNSELNVLATINFERAGLLKAQWEVATPSSTGGLAVFLPLHNINQYLAAGNQVVIRSPALPTDVKGLYRVRLRVLQPVQETSEVELRYQVNASRAVKASPAQQITHVLPKNGAEINTTSEFSWAPQVGAVAYQLEIYTSAQASKPLSGLLLTAEQVRSPLSASVLHALVPGEQYYWRVIAVDNAGEIIAASQKRKIRIRE